MKCINHEINYNFETLILKIKTIFELMQFICKKKVTYLKKKNSTKKITGVKMITNTAEPRVTNASHQAQIGFMNNKRLGFRTMSQVTNGAVREESPIRQLPDIFIEGNPHLPNNKISPLPLPSHLSLTLSTLHRTGTLKFTFRLYCICLVLVLGNVILNTVDPYCWENV